jgi:hypothetical protein
MAMVFLSERKTSAVEKNRDTLSMLNNDLKNNLEDLNILLDKKQKENKVPFGIQAKGHDITYNSPDSPGPGAYNLEPHQKPFNSGENSFIFKSPRFKTIDQESNNIPGPGSYNICKPVIFRNNIQQRPSSEVSFQYNTNSLNNIASIPAKKQKFGYYIDDNGDLIQAIDPEIDLYFSGTKSNSIGPDRYNPIIKEKNHCISWNKMSGRKPKNEKNNNLTNINNLKGEISLNSSKISLVDTDISSTVRSPKERKNSILKKNLKPYSLLIRNNKRRLNSSSSYNDTIPIDNEKELEFLNHENNIISGSKKKNIFMNFNKMRYGGKPEEFQFFLSSNERKTGQSLILSEFPNIGPGSYFRDTFKKFSHINNYKNKQNSWGKNIGREDSHNLKRSSSNLGPGSYNITKNFEKKSFNNYGSFSSEKRFDLSYLPENNNLSFLNSNNNIGNPGPGSYNYEDPWVKDVNKMVKRTSLVNVDEEIRKAENKRNKEKRPDFNLYQNDKYINIIQNNIRNKQNPFTSEHMPFSSGSKRFKMSKSQSCEDLGPGRYDIYKYEKKPGKIEPIIAPFSTNEERKPTYLGNIENNKLSPGSYNLDSYFDWNKKSFNALFI